MSMFEDWQPTGLQLNVRQSTIAVRKLHTIKSALADIYELVNAGDTVDSSALQSILSESTKSTGELSDLFSSLNPVFYNVRRTSRSAALAEKTFGTTELLEMVLLNLSPWTILKAQCTNRQFLKTIEGSFKLQQKMLLERSSSSSSSSLFSTLIPEGGRDGGDLFGLHRTIQPPGIPFDDDAYEAFFTFNTPIRTMEMFVHIDPGNLPRIGARCRKILLCDPIITTLTVYPGCCGALGDSEYFITWESELRSGVHAISNPSGLTIGDIYDAARLIKEHPECCFRGVIFRGSIGVSVASAVAKEYLDRRANCGYYYDDVQPEPELAEAEDELEDESTASVHGYDDSKEIAACNGQSTPTFEEFEAIGGSSWQHSRRRYF